MTFLFCLSCWPAPTTLNFAGVRRHADSASDFALAFVVVSLITDALHANLRTVMAAQVVGDPDPTAVTTATIPVTAAQGARRETCGTWGRRCFRLTRQSHSREHDARETHPEPLQR